MDIPWHFRLRGPGCHSATSARGGLPPLTPFSERTFPGGGGGVAGDSTEEFAQGPGDQRPPPSSRQSCDRVVLNLSPCPSSTW